MDREAHNKEADRIAEEIHQLSLDRHQIYERERQLIQRLVKVRRRRDSGARRQRLPSPEVANQGDDEVRVTSVCRVWKPDASGVSKR